MSAQQNPSANLGILNYAITMTVVGVGLIAAGALLDRGFPTSSAASSPSPAAACWSRSSGAG